MWDGKDPPQSDSNWLYLMDPTTGHIDVVDRYPHPNSMKILKLLDEKRKLREEIDQLRTDVINARNDVIRIFFRHWLTWLALWVFSFVIAHVVIGWINGIGILLHNLGLFQ